ncbi:MAG: sigma-70 family RNA polymerase sigma factor [Candidatus Poribacteria bacterium]|nr:sigma-70 family RNA polymerase sigma factor [Candidatus Poribacteria bacterium]
MERAETLIKRALDPNASTQARHDAFGELVRRFQDMAFGWAYATLGDAAQAQDATQEAFLTAYQQLAQLREPSAFPGWLKRIVQSRCHRITSRKRHPTEPLIAADTIAGTEPDAASRLESAETSREVWRAIQSLPEHERVATILYYISAYSQKEVAAFLEVPEPTVRKRLQSARNRLKRSFLNMVRDNLQGQRPSNDAQLENRVRFFNAVTGGDADAINRLLDDDPSLLQASYNGRTALYRAAQYGYSGRTQRYKNIVDLLIERGAEQDIFAAAFLNRPELAESLLDADPSLVLAHDGYGTALHHAAERGATQVAELLIERGADVNAKDDGGHSPLHNAGHPGPWKETESTEIIALLKANGAVIDIWLAATLGDTDAIAARLDADPDAVNATDDEGAVPLFHAAHNLHRDAIRLLVARGANPNAVCPDGQTPLSTAILHSWDEGGDEAVRLLLDAGAEPDFNDCCSLGMTDRVRERLEADATLAHPGSEGWTPLHEAARWGHSEVVELLIQHGADVNAVDEYSGAPLKVALHHSHEAVADILRQHGAGE